MEGRILTRRDISIDAVMDIEAGDWTTFVLGGLRRRDGTYDEFGWRHEQDYVDALLTVNGTVWAHFGGGYDYKWLLDHIARRGKNVQIAVAGSRVVSAKVGHTLFCDSYALAPMKLAELTAGLGVTKEKLALPCTCCKYCCDDANKPVCDCDNNCGGYCAVKRNMPREQMKRLSDYLRADCESLYCALLHLREYAADNDLDLGRTIGSSAWRNVQRRFGIQTANYATEDYKYVRRAYFGGRVQLYRHGIVEHGWEYDVNSMYPWTLSKFAVPVGRKQRIYGRGARSAFAKAQPGVYRAIVKVPEDLYLPPLPVRYNNDTSIAYPTGEFEGIWALPELQHAQIMGCDVEPIGGFVWDTQIVLFEQWIKELFHLRHNAPGGKKSPIGTFLKLYMNSLTGKFGSNIERETFVINPPQIKRCACKCMKCDREPNRCRCRRFQIERCMCGAHKQVSQYIFSSLQHRIEPCAHVEWASYLTAHARVALNKFQIMNDGGRDVIYSDTDSCFRTQRCDYNNGDELGQWKPEGEFTAFVGIAPKVYSFIRKEAIVAKAKGITLKRYPETRADGTPHPLAGKPIGRPETGVEYAKSGVVGFKSGAKRGKLFSARTMTRVLSERCGDRVKINEYETRPPRIDELEI